ncbi:MAG: L-2-hydroxyglutarate oxidase [Burkholderiaceae bacterium]
MHDFLIIGGGIVGCSVAWQLLQAQPQARIALLEKEPVLARHQTGHNSGVVHSGIYYPPGSLKADFCRLGNAATFDFCEAHGLPSKRTGKLLVASSPAELPRMQALFERSQQLGIAARSLGSAELIEIEPAIIGVGAIHLASTGIADYPAITRQMAQLFGRAGGEIHLDTKVLSLHETAGSIRVATTTGEFDTRQLICCAGIQADRLAALAGLAVDFAMLPFRGEYFRLKAQHNLIVSHLIYPIPDPDLPFLGVHLTRMIDGSVTVGPNAVLGLAREAYPKLSLNWRDMGDMLAFKGFWPLLRSHLRTGLAEMKNSLYKPGYLALCQRYCPSLRLADLEPMECGIRAQAVTLGGQLIHDFLIKRTARSLHVCNAPSPAATSAIPIGAHIVQLILGKTPT